MASVFVAMRDKMCSQKPPKKSYNLAVSCRVSHWTRSAVSALGGLNSSDAFAFHREKKAKAFRLYIVDEQWRCVCVQSWLDRLLAWNPDDYGGIDTVRVPVGQIWTPDIVLYN